MCISRISDELVIEKIQDICKKILFITKYPKFISSKHEDLNQKFIHALQKEEEITIIAEAMTYHIKQIIANDGLEQAATNIAHLLGAGCFHLTYPHVPVTNNIDEHIHRFLTKLSEQYNAPFHKFCGVAAQNIVQVCSGEKQ